ncbi:FAD-binding domain-containing protein [Actinophytocola sp.]|uniref:FAD-binding domain-containing protein n=1 Tax=Actinophytocola sp. TaxID=1872138 RepID=UPI00389AC993
MEPDVDAVVAGAGLAGLVPELRDLPGRSAHQPWTAPVDPVPRYPPPVVDHGAERRAALTRYDAVAATR